jgi:hypothetical protein
MYFLTYFGLSPSGAGSDISPLGPGMGPNAAQHVLPKGNMLKKLN